MSKAVPVILGLGLGALALVLLARKAEAAPPEPEIPSADVPTVDNIMGARNLIELDTYYDLINQLFVMGKIDWGAYTLLYEAYRNRFYELIGVS